MFRTKFAALVVGVAAVATMGMGAGFASTAHAATTETTNFTFPIGSTLPSTLSVTNKSPVPSNGTIVTYDLEQFVQQQNPNATGTTLAADIASAVNTLVTGGTYTPATGLSVNAPNATANNFDNVPQEQTPGNTSTYVLPSSDTTVSLYVVDSNVNTASNVTAATFEVSTTISGSPLTFTNTTNDPVEGSVTWDDTSTTSPVISTRSYVEGGHVITDGRSTATVGWDIPPVNSADGSCVVTETFGYGMTSPSGQPHYGYTCSGVGYLWGLSPGHTYSMLVIPAAAGASYSNRVPDPNGQATGFIDVVTTA